MHTVMVVATWLVATFGVTGAIIAIVASVYLGPTAVQAIIAPLFGRFLACTRCVVAAVIVIVAIGFYWLGHHQAEVECRADELNSRLAAQKADLEAAQKAKADEAARADKIEKSANDQHSKDLEFIARLKANPACGFDPDVADGLHGPRAAPAEPAAGTIAPPGPAARALSRFRLPLPLVQGGRMSGKRPERDAAPDR